MEYKGFKINSEKLGFGFKSISRIGSGTLPRAMDGLFSNESQAKHVIDCYLAHKELDKHAKAISTRRG